MEQVIHRRFIDLESRKKKKKYRKPSHQEFLNSKKVDEMREEMEEEIEIEFQAQQKQLMKYMDWMMDKGFLLPAWER